MSEKMTFEVTGQSEKMTTELKAKNHTLVIDEPANMGGRRQRRRSFIDAAGFSCRL